ncbi:MAG: ATP-binding cassette domain-containing protein, partial [Arenimonas sp.]
EQVLRNYLGTWNFAGDRAFEPVDGFSGGERARLALAIIAYNKPNVMLLDEPTNHLDLEMREALAEALSEFDGAIVMVSHDRHLIGLVCDTFWRVADGKVEAFEGDLDEYAAWLRARGNKASDTKTAKPDKTVKATAMRSENDMRGLRKRFQMVEAELEKYKAEKLQIENQFSDEEYCKVHIKELTALSSRQDSVVKNIESLEAEWLEIYEQLEAV